MQIIRFYNKVTMNMRIALLLIPLSLSAHDKLTTAIKLSNPALVEQEITLRLSQGKPFSLKEQFFYLNFCEEVITRRRNAIQFPDYSNGSPIYTQAFSTDPVESISGRTTIKFLTGILGALATIPICLTILEDKWLTQNERKFWTIVPFATETFFLYLLISSLNEINQVVANRKKSQEQLYENAIQIKHRIYDIEAA